MPKQKEVIFCNLEAEISRAQLTRADVAERLYINVGTLRAKLYGKSDFTLTEMLTLKAWLEFKTGRKLTLDYLFTNEEA